VLLGPEVSELVAGMIGDHSSLTGLPSGRADFTMFVSVLEGLDESEDFINVTADGEIGDAHVSEDTLVVNDVSSSKSDSLVTSRLDKSTVGFGDRFGKIRDHRDLHFAETSFSAGLLGVFGMSEMRINGASNNLSVDLFEFGRGIGELANLSWANKGEVERPEEENGVLSCNIRNKF
jgi:hypothetical protein